MTKEITIKEISPIVAKATALKISSPETMSQSAELLSQCNKFLDKVTADKKAITDPINKALKEVRAKYKPIEEPLEEAIAIIRKEQSQYQTSLILKQREQEKKISDRVAKGTLKIETAVSKLEALDRPETKVETNSGSVSFREDKVLKITDITKIPREYLNPDEKRILNGLKDGFDIPGCELETVMVPVNKR